MADVQVANHEHRVWRTIRALDQQGILGLDHVRLWRGVNSLVRPVGGPLNASYSLFLTATAHANMAVVCLRKLIDTTKNTVSVPYLLTLVDRHLGTILGEMRNRAPALQMIKAELQHLLGSHKKRLAEIKNRAAP